MPGLMVRIPRNQQEAINLPLFNWPHSDIGKFTFTDEFGSIHWNFDAISKCAALQAFGCAVEPLANGPAEWPSPNGIQSRSKWENAKKMNRSGDESFIVKLIWTILTACGGPGQCHSLNGHIPVLAHTRWVRSMGSLDRFVLVGINCVRGAFTEPSALQHKVFSSGDVSRRWAARFPSAQDQC